MTLNEKIEEFYQYRKEIKKPLREASKKAFLTRLNKLSGGREEVMIEILEQSIANSWQGIFELRGKAVKPNPVDGTLEAYNQVLFNIQNGG
jgi:hypothetical protein